MLIKSNTDYSTLPAEMLPAFKQHLRVLYNHEDDSIQQYLAGAIDAISIYGDIDIFTSDYEYVYIDGEVADTAPNSALFYTTRVNIFDVSVLSSELVDITDNFTVDSREGYIYPAPDYTDSVTFKAGYALQADISPNAINVIFRYGAHLYENREAINIGEPKFLPDWVKYAMASIWKPRT